MAHWSGGNAIADSSTSLQKNKTTLKIKTAVDNRNTEKTPNHRNGLSKSKKISPDKGILNGQQILAS